MTRVIELRLTLAACLIAVSRAHVATAAPPVDCDATLNPIFSNLHRSFVAKDANTPHQTALKAWPLVPTTCQTGRWYLAPSILTVYGDKDLTAGNVKILQGSR